MCADIMLTQSNNASTVTDIESEIKLFRCSTDYVITFGTLEECYEDAASKHRISMPITGLLDDPSVLIEGVLFRARYLGSTQLVCEGQPTKSTRMCQAEEAVSRIKVCYYLY